MSGRLMSSAENILIKLRVICDVVLFIIIIIPPLLTTDEPPRLLKCITAPVVDDRTCESMLENFISWSSGMICAGQADTDNCLVSMFTAQKTLWSTSVVELNLTCHPPTPSLPPTVE